MQLDFRLMLYAIPLQYLDIVILMICFLVDIYFFVFQSDHVQYLYQSGYKCFFDFSLFKN